MRLELFIWLPPKLIIVKLVKPVRSKAVSELLVTYSAVKDGESDTLILVMLIDAANKKVKLPDAVPLALQLIILTVRLPPMAALLQVSCSVGLPVPYTLVVLSHQVTLIYPVVLLAWPATLPETRVVVKFIALHLLC
jgi:hypothetical protein